MRNIVGFLAIFIMLIFISTSMAASMEATEGARTWDTNPPRKTLTWTLTTSQSATGASTNHALKVWRCSGQKNLKITTTDLGGGVDIEITPKEGAVKRSIVKPGLSYLKKYTTAAAQPALVITHDVEEFELYSTITQGAITAVLSCVAGG